MTWNQFFNSILKEVEEVRTHSEYPSRHPIFRGLSDNTYDLLPSLFRNLPHKTRLLDYEQGMYLLFEAQSGIFYPNSKRSSWEILYEMRHHGLPTRLLDWTGNFAVALFFALRKFNQSSDNQRTPCIWILNPANVNFDSVKTKKVLSIASQEPLDYKKLYLRTPIAIKNPVVIFPIKNNSRLLSQNSYFTVHGRNSKPLNEIYPDYVKQIDIPKKIIPSAKKFLNLININEYTLYHDLDGLGRYMQEHYCQNF